MTVTYTIGDTREVIATIPDGSVDLIASSPPFLALRSYVPADHASKGDEIGSEANPAEFIDMLLGLTAEWGRVLAPHGSIAIELGDTYAGGGAADSRADEHGKIKRNDYTDRPSFNRGSGAGVRTNTPGWPRAKSLALIPQLYAVALAYGINPLTGQPSPAGRWLVRNVIVWHRPNPAVGALGDKVRPSTSYIVVATRSPKRWFDLTAVRGEPAAPSAQAPSPKALRMEQLGEHGKGMPATGTYHANGGAPPLDAWFDQYDGSQENAGADAPSHDTWTLTTQPSRISVKIPTRVLCGPDDGGERTTSPDCPVHGDQAAPAPTAPDGVPLDGQSSFRTPRTDDHRGLGPQQSDACDAATSSCSHRTRSSATPCDKESSRTDLDQSTSAPDTPFAQTADGTPHTPASPESSGDHLDTSASSTGEVCPRVDVPETVPHTDRKSDPSSACSCTFHLVKDSIHSHYAMWPAKLAERLILMMCPREVCRICGEPRRRVEKDRSAFDFQPRLAAHIKERREGCGYTIAEVNEWFGYVAGAAWWEVSNKAARIPNVVDWVVLKDRLGLSDEFDEVVTGERVWTESLAEFTPNTRHGLGPADSHRNQQPMTMPTLKSATRHSKDAGWTDCGHDDYRPGLTLDPFAGSGTTLAVADLHHRDAIGIDFDARNKAIYPARYDEVKKALFGTVPEMPGQMELAL